MYDDIMNVTNPQIKENDTMNEVSLHLAIDISNTCEGEDTIQFENYKGEASGAYKTNIPLLTMDVEKSIVQAFA